MIEKIGRYYLEISPKDNFKKKSKPPGSYEFYLNSSDNFEINKSSLLIDFLT